MSDGFLNLHKSAGWTSHDCVAKLRRLLNTKKVGHAGTLDPAATGVLPVAVGRATRLLQYLPSEKAYRAVVQLGTTTDTDDLEGQIQTQTSANHLTQSEVAEQLAQFQGEIEQIPPLYSAIHVQGQRLYDLARRGEAVDVPSRTVTVHSLDIVSWQPGEIATITFDIACGAGTYIRSIARDLGQKLGVGGTLASLLRTQSSGFTLETSVALDTLTAQPPDEIALLSPVGAMAHLPPIVLSPEDGRRWCLGQRLPKTPTFPMEQPLRVITDDCPLLGIGMFMVKEDRPHLVPKMVWASPTL